MDPEEKRTSKCALLRVHYAQKIFYSDPSHPKDISPLHPPITPKRYKCRICESDMSLGKTKFLANYLLNKKTLGQFLLQNNVISS